MSNLKAPPVQTIGALHDHGLSYNTGGESGWPKDYVEVNGFVRSVRKQKRVAFAALSDGTTLEPLQIVLTPEQAEGYVSRLSVKLYNADDYHSRLSTGVAVKARGIRVESRGAGQEYEVQAERVTVMGDNDATVCMPTICESEQGLTIIRHTRYRRSIRLQSSSGRCRIYALACL